MALVPYLQYYSTTDGLDYTGSCGNIKSGVQIYNQYFNNPSDPYWSATPPIWSDFWRSILEDQAPIDASSKVPHLSDSQINAWANTSGAVDFFADTYNPLYSYFWDNYNETVDLTDLHPFERVLLDAKICQTDKTQNTDNKPSKALFYYSSSSYTISNMIADCLVFDCCGLPSDSQKLHNGSILYPGTQWTYPDACAFRICGANSTGNPDLGGIGVVVANYIEVSMLAFVCLAMTLRILVGFTWSESRSSHRGIALRWNQHNRALADASAALLDASAYYSISVSIASVIYNYRAHPSLYEAKLSQATSLFTINTPVTMLALLYRQSRFQRIGMRRLLVAVAALLTFMIQFMFRKAKSYPEEQLTCLNWGPQIETSFERRYIVKGIWAILLMLVLITPLLPVRYTRSLSDIRWPWQNRYQGSLPKKQRQYPTISTYLRVPNLSKRLHTSRSGPGRALDESSRHIRVYNGAKDKLKQGFHAFTAWLKALKAYIKDRRNEIIAVLVAVYGILDSIFDIVFIQDLRSRERRAGYENEDNKWGYGQLLAVAIWIPVIVEYIHTWFSDESKAIKGQETTTHSSVAKDFGDDHADGLKNEKSSRRGSPVLTEALIDDGEARRS